jgi:hypothetical protein
METEFPYDVRCRSTGGQDEGSEGGNASYRMARTVGGWGMPFMPNVLSRTRKPRRPRAICPFSIRVGTKNEPTRPRGRDLAEYRRGGETRSPSPRFPVTRAASRPYPPTRGIGSGRYRGERARSIDAAMSISAIEPSNARIKRQSSNLTGPGRTHSTGY